MAFCYRRPRHVDGDYCVTPVAMREWERAQIAQCPGRDGELMEIAGSAVARYALDRYPNTREALVFCGPGNNGGDAFVVARYLKNCGISVHLFVLGDDAKRGAVAAEMYRRVRGLAHTALCSPDDATSILTWEHRSGLLVIDGIFGTGYHPSHDAIVARVCECIARIACPVVSIDIPSGIDGRTGYRGALGDDAPPSAVMATDTVTFGSPKTGHFLGEGPAYCGRLECVDIGLARCEAVEGRSLVLSDAYCEGRFGVRNARRIDAHKGKCGHVVTIGGAPEMPGAACMAAYAALRAGCGLSSVAARRPMRTRDEIIVHAIETEAHQIDESALHGVLARADCLVIGPGLGRGKTTIDVLRAVEHFGGSLVLDADALWALPSLGVRFHPERCFATPHPMEAARLCGVTVEEILYDPVHFASLICKKYGVTAILKSHATVVVGIRDDAMCSAILPYPNPALATAGAGDVLAGITGSLAAQVRGGAMTEPYDAFDIACMAVHRHSLAGRRAAEMRGNALCATDVIDAIVS